MSAKLSLSWRRDKLKETHQVGPEVFFNPRSGCQHKVSHPSRDARPGTPPWVERSETPGNRNGIRSEPMEWAAVSVLQQALDCEDFGSATAVAHFAGWESNTIIPGVSLRSTPGRGPRPSISAGVRDFMLTPATRVKTIKPGETCSEVPLVCSLLVDVPG
jgi:hypothetical protein